ncbi:MAG: recombinase family protein [Dehalococcoidales bacterium]|jgi:site-specific DNA recombinase
MNKENGAIRVATYTRVSTQEQAQEGTSLDFQDSQLTTLCQLQRWSIINSYTDPGYSGKDGSRPGLERLLADAKIRLFDKVVVYKLDRLARNLRLLLEIEQKFKAYGVTITSVKESVDTSTGTGKMVFQMFGMIAEWERDAIIERTKSGRLQRYKDGCWAGGSVIFGYAYNKATKKLIIDESEARIVRRIYSEYRDGKMLHGISEGLNKDKIPGRTKHSLGWRQNVIRDILVNPMYRGTQIVNRHASISNINKIDLDNTIQISVPAIVDEQTWQIAQERLKNNKHVKPIKQGEFLLQGMISCGLCGYAYRAARVHKARYYYCRGKMKDHHLDGSPRCKSNYLNAEWLEKQVWHRVEEIINDPNRLFEVLKNTIENLRLREADLNARIKPIEERLAEIASQKAKLADDWVVRHMNNDKFKELKDNLDREESRIRALKAEIDPSQLADLESTRGVLYFWEDQIKSMAWNTENEDGSMMRLVNGPHQIALKVVGFEDKTLSDTLGFPASKRELLDKLQVKLVVFSDRIEVNGLFPIQPIDIQSLVSTKGDKRGF